MVRPADSTSPLGEQPDEVTDLPGFGASRRSRLDPPMTSTTTTAPPPMGERIYDPDRDLDDELADDRFEEPTSSPRSSSRASIEPDPALVESFAELATLAVSISTVLIARFARSTAFLATEDEAGAIGEPLARIVARHAPMDEAVAGDAADGIEAGYHAVKYGMRATEDHMRGGMPRPEVVP